MQLLALNLAFGVHQSKGQITVARPSKLTAKISERLVWAATVGGSMRDIAASARISVQTLYNWLEKDDEFAMRFEEARAISRLQRLGELAEADRTRDNRSVEAWLSRTSDDYRHVDRRVDQDDTVDYDKLRNTLQEIFGNAPND